jgi:hypothetical protein
MLLGKENLMSLTNEEIATHTYTLFNAILKNVKMKPEEQAAADAAFALATNLLQNINDLAYSAVEQHALAQLEKE